MPDDEIHVSTPRVDTPGGAIGSTGFGPTIFSVADGLKVPRTEPAFAFDVCHVGVVLRAVLFVHVVVGIGMAFIGANFTTWLGNVAIASSIALPAVLMWLMAGCASKRVFSTLPMPAQWALALLLGALCGGASSWLMLRLAPDLLGGMSAPWRASALAGAALSAILYLWLHLRSLATLPAETAARLAELQSRIRPHFLFNTLNTALTLIRLDPTRAEAVLEDLAELFRVAISESAESVTLAQEVALAQRYLDIEQIRFGNRLHVNWELDPDAGHARVPPLILQPLVENAVRHGVEPSAEGGVIRVRTRVKLGRAVLTIANSVPDQPSRHGNGMALRNVKERLRLMHDVAAQFETRLVGDVFRVQIVVPL